ncbi:MAG: histidine triad nucleotide-binding protein [Elusimicrobia bacterium]|nr:histidine triad nucleotide-binding protein [Elusimicrobiota bacterium]
MPPDCIFCKIASGEVKSRIEHEDDDIVVFHDLNPHAPVHLLIIPKKHIGRLSECSEDDVHLLGKIQLAAKKIAAKLNIENGFRLVTNNGRNAGQSVDHIHYHLLGGRRMNWPPG